MKTAIDKLKPFDKKRCCWNVIIETPKGSAVKYSYDAETGLLSLTRALPQGMTFPFNFGFIPRTLADDGDPLDVLVFNEVALIPGSHLHVRAAGVIRAVQTEDKREIRNDRVIVQAIPKETPTDLEKLKLTDNSVLRLKRSLRAITRRWERRSKCWARMVPKKQMH